MTTLADITLDPARQRKAREYSRLSRRGSFLELGISLILLLVFLFTGASAKLATLLPFPLPWRAALYLLILAMGYGVIIAPLDYYYDFTLLHRYGLSAQALAGWLRDKAKALALFLSLGLCLIIAVYGLMGYLPTLWWLISALIVILLSLFLTWINPTLLMPLFFKLNPLEEGELKERLLNLSKRARVNIKNVLTMNLSSKFTTANAMLCGWGKSRRIIFSDTLLQEYSPDEIEVTLAHELGHHLHHDIAKLMAIQAIAFLLAFYLANLALKTGVVLFSFQGISDLAALPWLILVLAVLILLSQPLLNWYNRRIELAADKFALELSNNPQAFISLMAKLTNQNLSEAKPSRWAKFLFYDHPPYDERVGLARDYPVIASQDEVSEVAIK
ncbi:MAG: M48 family metallopeptidase [Dehalococcoidia bacterium]|nr:M48 family metallopeptidase [Dehalococcoidia bacterium]